MVLFGKSKEELALEQEVDRLTRQNRLLLLLFDAWITSLKKDYESSLTSSDSGRHMSWTRDPHRVILEDRDLRAKLEKAKTRGQMLEAYATSIPNIVSLILETAYCVPDLPEKDQDDYEEAMARVRMYFFSVRGMGKDPNDIRIGDPPSWDPLPPHKRL